MWYPPYFGPEKCLKESRNTWQLPRKGITNDSGHVNSSLSLFHTIAELLRHQYTGVWFLVHDPPSRDGKCVPMQFWSTDLRSEIWWSPDLFSSNMQFWSSSDSCFSSKNLNVDQNCIFEENKSGDHQISERRSVDQNCIGTHLPSRERGGRGPKIIPSCSSRYKCRYLFWWSN